MTVEANSRLWESCDACGHSSRLHSNEACEAIRCDCRATQKLLSQAGGIGFAGTVPVGGVDRERWGAA